MSAQNRPTGARLRSRLAAVRAGWPQRALYAALSVPLAAVYAALFLGLVASVVFAVQGIGIVLLFVLLATARGLGGIERRLARRLLGLDIAPDVRLRHEPGHVVRRLQTLVLTSSTWRTLGWLGARVLLGLGVLVTLVFGISATVALVFEATWSPWTALPLLALLALVLVVVLVALELQVRIAAAAASRMLGIDPEEKLAVLRESSQRLADRNRLARDLHDTIGHSLTASLLQATAARRTLAPGPAGAGRLVDADFARQALEHIETNTRAALSELDRALAVLRDEQAGTPLQVAEAPDLTRLDGLLAGLRDGGLPVTLDVDAGTCLADLPPEVSALGYRVVQEGTTNVLRHAGCAPTVVGIARAGDTLTVRVQNLLAFPAESRPGPGGGSGLSGLQARTQTVGGELQAGPTPGGGFELCATLPLVRA